MQVRKVLLAATAVFALASPGAALAQDWDHDGGHHRDHDEWRGGEHGEGRDHEWREHEARERRDEWREHERREHGYGWGYPGYGSSWGSGYNYRRTCWREYRPTWDGRYVLVRRCR